MSAVSSSQLLCQKVFWLLLLANVRNTRSKSSVLNRPFFGSHLLQFSVITFKLFGLPDWLERRRLVCGAYTHVPTRFASRIACWLVGWSVGLSCGYFGVYYCALLCSVRSSVSSSSSSNATHPRERLRAALHYSCLQVRKINLVIIAIRTEALGSYITSAILLTLTLFSTVLESRASHCRSAALQDLLNIIPIIFSILLPQPSKFGESFAVLWSEEKFLQNNSEFE